MTRATPHALAFALVAGPAAFVAAVVLFRRYRRDLPAALLVVLAVAAGAAAGALSSAQPTGFAAVDVVERCGLAIGLTVLAAHANRRILLVVAVAVLAAGIGTPASAATAAALGLLLAVEQPPAWTRVASSAGIVAGILGLPTALGAGAGLVAGGAAAVLFVAGLAGLDRRPRRLVLLASGAVVGLAVIAVGMAAASVRPVPDRLQAAEQAADRGMKALDRGDHQAALDELGNAHSALDAAQDALDRPAARPANLVPGAAQNLDAVNRVTTALDTLVVAVNSAAREGDPTSFVPTNGQVDLAAIDRLAPQVAAADDAATRAQATIVQSRSPFLLPMANDKLDQAAQRLADAEHTLGTFKMASQTLGDLLGGGGRPRRAFVAFTNPAEVRGSAGVLGSYAELGFDNGRVSLLRTGRDGDLNTQGVDPAQRTLASPDGYVQTWGRYQPQATWQNVTASPDFPSVGQVISSLYPQSGGDDVDLVFLVDPAGMGALLQLSGPVTVPDWPAPITADNVVPLLGIDQYGAFPDNDQRAQFLSHLSEATFQKLLTLDAGQVTGHLGCVGDAAGGHHLLAWSAQPDEEALFARLGVDGALPSAAGGNDVAGVALNNAAGNKLDWFRSDTTAVSRSLDTATGDRLTTLTFTMTNNAPTSGYPDYVLAGANPSWGGSPGENRTLVSGYTSGAVDSVAVDGVKQPFATDHEAGLELGSVQVDLPPGQAHTVVFTFRDRPDQGIERPLVLLPAPPGAQAVACGSAATTP